MEIRRVIVTGSSGFIGRYLIHELLKINGLEIICVGKGSNSPFSNSRILYKNIDLLKNSIEFFQLLTYSKPSHFIHLAWDTRHGLYWNSVLNEEWTEFSKRAIAIFVENGGRRALISGTSAEIDLNSEIVAESAPYSSNITIYGRAKLELLNSMSKINLSSRFNWVWPRLFNIYGPNEDTRRIIPKLFGAALSGDPVILSNLDSKADFIYVKDVARAIRRILFSELTGVINIAYGESISIRDIIKSVENVIGNRVNVVEDESLYGASNFFRGYRVDIRKIRLSTGWSPIYSVEEGLIEYARQENFKQIIEWKK